MKQRQLTYLVLGLLVCLGLPSRLSAQDDRRFIITPINNAVTPFPVLRMQVDGVNAQIYQEIDAPNVGGNAVAAFLDPAQEQNLRQNPDLRIEEDRPLEPAGSAGGGGPYWSPDRIDQRAGTDTFYLPDFIEACGEHRPFIYICDTGVFGAHDEFVSAGSRLAMTGVVHPSSASAISVNFRVGRSV